MTTVSNIRVSPAFHKHFDPVANIKSNLERALAADGLELWFMASRPPTREECEVGHQWLLAGTDDLPMQEGEDQRAVMLSDTVRGGPQAFPVANVLRLTGTDWAHMRDVVDMPDFGGASTALSIVPATAGEGGLTVWGNCVDSYLYRSHQYVSHYAGVDMLPWRYRWALLMPKQIGEPSGCTWARMQDQREFRSGHEEEGDGVLLDFRGGIPLSLGPRSSNANVRIDTALAKRDYRQPRHSSTKYYYEFYYRVGLYGIHVPMPSLTSNAFQS